MTADKIFHTNLSIFSTQVFDRFSFIKNFLISNGRMFSLAWETGKRGNRNAENPHSFGWKIISTYSCKYRSKNRLSFMIFWWWKRWFNVNFVKVQVRCAKKKCKILGAKWAKTFEKGVQVRRINPCYAQPFLVMAYIFSICLNSFCLLFLAMKFPLYNRIMDPYKIYYL